MAGAIKSIETLVGGVELDANAKEYLGILSAHAVARYGHLEAGEAHILTLSAFSNSPNFSCSLQPDMPAPELGSGLVTIDRVTSINARTGHMAVESTVPRPDNMPTLADETVYGFMIHPELEGDQSTVIFRSPKSVLALPEIRSNFDAMLFNYIKRAKPLAEL